MFARKIRLFALAVVILAFRTSPTMAEDWGHFRGGNAHGYSADGSIPNAWTRDDYRWITALPGGGVGSPVVYQGTAYLLCASPERKERSVVAISLDAGAIRWQKTFPMQVHSIHARNSFASSTPAVDSTGLYVAFADPQRITLVAMEHDGEIRWERDLGTWQSQHGFGASPTILDGKLVLFNSQQSEQLKPGEKPGVSRMMAFDLATGNTLWETPLTTTRACYGVPLLRTNSAGEQEIIGANTGDGIFALRPTDGKLLWRLPVFTARVVSCPLQIDDLLIATAGAGGGGNHLVAVLPPDRQDDAKTQSTAQPTEAYRIERNAPYVPTPAIVGTRLYSVDDRGIAACFDGLTGDSLWTLRLGGNFGASPVVIGDKVLAIALDGTAHVISLSGMKHPPFSLGNDVQATPTLFESGMLLRVGNELCCLSTKN